MENKIYVIGNGCYSDWGLNGYATSEKEAQRIVAEKNGNDREWNDYWYEDLDLIVHERCDNPPILVITRYECNTNNGENEKLFPIYENEHLTIKPLEKKRHYGGRITIRKTFPLGTSKEKMLKVLRDIAAEYRAELRGI